MVISTQNLGACNIAQSQFDNIVHLFTNLVVVQKPNYVASKGNSLFVCNIVTAFSKSSENTSIGP